MRRPPWRLDRRCTVLMRLTWGCRALNARALCGPRVHAPQGYVGPARESLQGGPAPPLHHSLYLKRDILIALKRYYLHQAYAVQFVDKLVGYLLDNKFLHINGHVAHKTESLSTGEKIATNAANLLQEIAFEDLVARYKSSGFLEMFVGYVDNVLAVTHPVTDMDVPNFLVSSNEVDTEQFRWKAKMIAECTILLFWISFDHYEMS